MNITSSETIRFNANTAIDSFILGSRYREFTHKFIKDDVCPYCDLTNKRICSPVLPMTINADTDKIIRGKNEHEAGHARFTPCTDGLTKWGPTMHNLVNALEDERIERGVAKMSRLFDSDLHFMNNTVISDLNRKLAAGEKKIDNPYQEAIFALHFEANGHSHMWSLSPMAQELYDAARPIYKENESTMALENDGENRKQFNALVSIAERIIEKWKSISQDNGNSESSDGNGQSQSSQKDDGGKESSGNGDASKGKDQSNGNSSNENSSDGDADGKDDNGKSNGGSDGDAGEGKGLSNGGSSNGGSSNGDADGDADNSEKSSGDGKKQSNKTRNRHGGSKKKSGVSSQGDGESDFRIDGEKEFGDLMEDEIRVNLAKRLREEGDETENYTAYTDGDRILAATEDSSLYDIAKSEMAGSVSKMSSCLEQSLRTLSRCRVIGNCERGTLNRRDLPAIAKSLTKNIFYQKTKGISLDVAVTVLVDESGSTSAEMPEYRKLAVAFSEVLERLGIQFEVLGHTTGWNEGPNDGTFTRTTGMVIYEHKTFDQKYNAVKHRVANMRANNCNLDGEALLHAFKRNIARHASRHVILVISDGMPSGMKNVLAGYKFLENVVKVCRKNGVEVYGFGVGTDLPKRFYGEDNFIELASTKEMHGGFFKRFSEIIVNGNMTK